MKLAILLCAPIVLAAATLGPTGPRATPIADAAMRGDAAAVRKLIDQRADVNAAQGDGMTALHWAAEHGDVAMAELLLKAHAKVGATTRIGSYTPLHIAGKSGSGPVVKALLQGGSDANLATAAGATALHFAAASGSVEAVTALADAHADVNAKESEWGQTPLMFAAAADRGAVIRVLIKRGADPSIKTKMVNLTEQGAQDQAANRKRAEVMMSLLPAAVRDSMKAATVATAAAATPGLPGIPAVPAGGPDAPGAPGVAAAQGGGFGGQGGQGGGGGRGGPQVPTEKLTPAQIQEAIIAGRTVLTTPPATKTVDEDTTDGQVAGYAGTVGNMGGLTAMHHAVRQGNLEAVVALLDGGADINQPSAGDGTTPLLLAAINGQFDVALKLVERGANVNLLSTAGAGPLYVAINTMWAPRSRFPQPQAVQSQKTTHIELMKALLKAGADPNVRLKQNLWYFAYNNCGNANCGLENLEGTTPFWRAAYAVDVDAMRVLVAAGADPSVPSFKAPAAPRGAGRGGRGGGRGGRGAAPDSAAAAQLAQRGGGGGGGGFGRGQQGPPLDPATDSASKAVPPGIGVYAIHDAAGVGYGSGFAGNSHRHAPDGWMPAMRYLVDSLHMDVNQRDLNGYTALHHAAARGDNEMILYLVAHGADVKAVSRRGQTTVDMANGPVSRISPIPETIALLEKLGAKNSHRCASC
ncbi:MAG: ankyrin repeat domain-containing protein [bacterium]